MDFEKICMMFTMQEPYYGIILSSMNRIPVKPDICPTMGVGRAGNCFKLVYNPDFVGKLDVDATLLLLKHECLHLVLNHFDIWETEDVPDDIHQIRNIANDLEVNCYLDRTKAHGLKGCWVEDFKWEKRLGAREYFRKLMELIQDQQQTAQNPNQPCNGGQGGQQGQNGQGGQNSQSSQNSQDNSQQNQQSNQSNSQNQQSQGQTNGQSGQSFGQNKSSGSGAGNSKISQESLDQFDSFDDHSMWPDENMEDVSQMIDDLVVAAAEEVEKSQGTVPSELKQRIDAIRNKKKPKPVADWKRYVRRYLGHEFSEFIRKSKKRESRRFPDAAGNRHRRKSHILVGIDTSGSISMPEYLEFFGQIKTLSPTATFRVLECDARINYEYEYKNKPNMTVSGGGGTSFQPVIDRFIKEKKIYDALIYFTDGYASIPENTPKETLWVISSNGDQSSRKKYQVNGSSVAFIPKKS